MNVTQFAEEYVTKRSIEKTPIYSARRFEKLLGEMPIADVCEAHLIQFAHMCGDAKYSGWTTKGGIKDIRTLVIAATGKDPGTIKTKVPDPDPQPVPIESIDACWPHMPDWCRQWTVVSYWTALRLADVIRLQKTGVPSDQIIWIAKKTGRTHRVPIPAWMKQFTSSRAVPFKNNIDHNARIVRAKLAECCKKAGVAAFLPSHVRDRALTEWLKADGTAGKIIHGCGLGVLDHYASKADLILHAGERLVMPACFDAAPNTTDAMMRTFKRLDAVGQKLIAETASRMVRVS